MIKVSIVVPIYNVEKYLRQCLDSLITQSLKDIEIICVNDGSTDASLQIMREYERKDKRVIVIDKPNTGYGNSMNRGFDIAQGEYIGIVESDDYADHDMFENLYNTAVAEEADVVKSNFYFYYSAIEERNKFFELIPRRLCGECFSPSDDLQGANKVNFWNAKPSIWSAIYRADFIRHNKIRFNETPGASYQDASFSFQVWTCARRVFCVYAAYLHYRQDNANSSVNNPGKVYCVCDEYDAMLRFLENNPKRDELYPLMNRLRYDSYMWNIERISEEFVKDFATRMAEDFRKEAAAGRLNKRLFDPYRWERLTEASSTPAIFAENIINERHVAALAQKNDQLRNDLIWRIDKLREEVRNNTKPRDRWTKKIRTAISIFRHEGIGGVLRVIKEKLR